MDPREAHSSPLLLVICGRSVCPDSYIWHQDSSRASVTFEESSLFRMLDIECIYPSPNEQRRFLLSLCCCGLAEDCLSWTQELLAVWFIQKDSSQRLLKTSCSFFSPIHCLLNHIMEQLKPKTGHAWANNNARVPGRAVQSCSTGGFYFSPVTDVTTRNSCCRLWLSSKDWATEVWHGHTLGLLESIGNVILALLVVQMETEVMFFLTLSLGILWCGMCLWVRCH